ncbi:MAG: hypothetical protein R3B09_26640 [Nannocystaceae bacterium]
MAEAEAPADPPPRRRRRRPLWIAAQVIIGLGLGAAITEWAFAARDDHAFPHANFYLADPELGVRLEPGAEMRFRLHDNPISTIHVNQEGFRGGEWPAAGGADEVIVVGDSQVFGLGVDDDATFSAKLAEKTGRSVINGGVPTYGPAEYLATARALLEERGAKTVVVALNFVNDPFELDRPNRERHAVWDGWAVRAETAPAELTEFPGRRWLMSRSHAVYALRRWLHDQGRGRAPEGESVTPMDLGTPSEGDLGDLVGRSKEAHAAADAEVEEAERALGISRERLELLPDEIEGKRQDLDRVLLRAYDLHRSFDLEDRRVARAEPGDIVIDTHAEASRSAPVTAALIREAARNRRRALKELLKREAKDGTHEAGDLVKAEGDLQAERQRLLAELAAGAPPPTRPPSIFREYLAELKALCDQHGAALVVVALPIDVQVDPAEWAKYGIADAPDMAESLILIDDLIADARELGLRAVDATPALRAAEPGAFLDGDIHMTAKGHAALADALADALAAPIVPPLRPPALGLPAGRSFAPARDEWSADDDLMVRGSSAAGCLAQIEREWLRVQCHREKLKDRLLAVEVLEGATPATMALRTEDTLSLLTPMTVGQSITARFRWKSAVRDLEVRWPEDEEGKPHFAGAFVEVADPPDLDPALAPPPEATAAAADPMCLLHILITREVRCVDPDTRWFGERLPEGCRSACINVFGDRGLLGACEAAFPEREASARLSCVQNDPLFAPPCPEGQVHAFASNRCFAACDPDHPCAEGTCTPWQGGGVCL